MATDYGSDLSCTQDLVLTMPEVSGVLGVEQAMIRRLITPRGGLLDDPAYGTDISALIDDSPTTRQSAIIAQQIDVELQKDERILSSQTTGEFRRDSSGAYKYIASTVATSADGPFRLVLQISNVSVDVLQIGR